MKLTMINDRWGLYLPEHRADRPEWPWWEATRLAAMYHFIKHGDVVYDIGAEEGDFPALFVKWGAKVVLVEPNPLVWPNIRAIFGANLATHGLLGSFVGFASDTTADATGDGLTVKEACIPDGFWPDCAYGEVIGDHGFRHLAQETDTTPQITIDELALGWLPPPDHITMDVEGSELRVLRGAEQTIKSYRPYVWVSVHGQAMMDLYEDFPADIDEMMRGLDYEAVFLCFDHESHMLFVPKEKCWPL